MISFLDYQLICITIFTFAPNIVLYIYLLVLLMVAWKCSIFCLSCFIAFRTLKLYSVSMCSSYDVLELLACHPLHARLHKQCGTGPSLAWPGLSWPGNQTILWPLILQQSSDFLPPLEPRRLHLRLGHLPNHYWLCWVSTCGIVHLWGWLIGVSISYSATFPSALLRMCCSYPSDHSDLQIYNMHCPPAALPTVSLLGMVEGCGGRLNSGSTLLYYKLHITVYDNMDKTSTCL